MRGFPLLQVLIVAALFALAGWPVWQLTRPANDAAVAPAPPPALATATPAWLNIEASFAPAPLDFDIECQDQTVLTGKGPSGQFSTRWQTVLPKEGVDLVLRAKWAAVAGAAAQPSAARLTVVLPDGSRLEKSFWVAPGQALAEVFTVL